MEYDIHINNLLKISCITILILEKVGFKVNNINKTIKFNNKTFNSLGRY